MPETEEAKKQGAFYESLKRNNTQIREDRMQAVGEDCEQEYRRGLEDLAKEKRRLERKRASMLDLSPKNSFQLVPSAEEFDATGFFTEDSKIGVQIREIDIKLELGLARYKELFGKELKLD